MNRVLGGSRPHRPTLPDGGDVSDEIWSLVSSSWAHTPSERPSAVTLVRKLSEMIGNTLSHDQPYSSEHVHMIFQDGGSDETAMLKEAAKDELTETLGVSPSGAEREYLVV